MKDGKDVKIRDRKFEPLTIPVDDHSRYTTLADFRARAERWRERFYSEVAEEVEVLPPYQPTVYDLEAEDDAAMDISWFNSFLMNATLVLTELG